MKQRTSRNAKTLQVLAVVCLGMVLAAILAPADMMPTVKYIVGTVGVAGLISVLNTIISTLDAALWRLQALESSKRDD